MNVGSDLLKLAADGAPRFPERVPVMLHSNRSESRAA
jgi:hypothetical protein